MFTFGQEISHCRVQKHHMHKQLTFSISLHPSELIIANYFLESHRVIPITWGDFPDLLPLLNCIVFQLLLNNPGWVQYLEHSTNIYAKLSLIITT